MIKIVCVGKVKEKYLQEAISDYMKRLSKYHKIDIIELEDSKILINIDAEDSTSFRASINSAIKWIKLALEINNLTN